MKITTKILKKPSENHPNPSHILGLYWIFWSYWSAGVQEFLSTDIDRSFMELSLALI